MRTSTLALSTIFTLDHDGRTRPSDWSFLAGLVLAAWLGTVAFVGQYRPNEVAGVLARIAPPAILHALAVVAALVIAAIALAARRSRQAGAAVVVVVYIAAHALFEALYPHFPIGFAIPFRSGAEALQFAGGRLLYGAALGLPMLAAFVLVFRRADGPGLALGPGDLRVVTRDVSAAAPPVPAWRALVGGYAAFCAIAFVVLQGTVGFGPLRSGELARLLPSIVLAAFANAAAEEFIFRGLLQPALIRAGGARAGLWMQGLLFGLVHWGASVGVLAALPTSLLIGFGSVVWGKYALDTRGLLWVVLAHGMLDVAVMGAYFVPRP